jgi:hypothetical protein
LFDNCVSSYLTNFNLCHLTFSTRQFSSCDHLACDIPRTVQAHISRALNKISKKKLSDYVSHFFLLRYSATMTQNRHKINVNSFDTVNAVLDIESCSVTKIIHFIQKSFIVRIYTASCVINQNECREPSRLMT